MKKLIVTPDYDPRAAGMPDRCLYCKQLLGAEHADDCVLVKKKVTVRFSIELPVRVPASWDSDMIEFYFNDGTHCLDTEVRRFTDIFNWLDNRQPNTCHTCQLIKVEVVDQ